MSVSLKITDQNRTTNFTMQSISSSIIKAAKLEVVSKKSTNASVTASSILKKHNSRKLATVASYKRDSLFRLPAMTNSCDHSCDSTILSSVSSESQHSSILKSACSKRRRTNSNASTTKGHVSFGTVKIRNYEVTVSDHPSCQEGPAISFGWEYTDYKHAISIDIFESLRQKHRLSKENLLVPPQARKAVLKLWGVTNEQIKEASIERKLIQNQRFETRKQEIKKARRKKRLQNLLGVKNVKLSKQTIVEDE